MKKDVMDQESQSQRVAYDVLNHKVCEIHDTKCERTRRRERKERMEKMEYEQV
jgi:hypothetical protein